APHNSTAKLSNSTEFDSTTQSGAPIILLESTQKSTSSTDILTIESPTTGAKEASEIIESSTADIATTLPLPAQRINCPIKGINQQHQSSLASPSGLNSPM